MPIPQEPQKTNMTPYQVFAACANHLLKQKVRSEENDFSLYHCDDGRKCAIGIFMDREHADWCEGTPVSDDIVLSSLNIETPPPIVKVLCAMQDIHDSVPTEHWSGAINVLARKLGFKPKKPAFKKGKRR